MLFRKTIVRTKNTFLYQAGMMDARNIILTYLKKILKYNISVSPCFRLRGLDATIVKFLALGMPSMDVHLYPPFYQCSPDALNTMASTQEGLSAPVC